MGKLNKGISAFFKLAKLSLEQVEGKKLEKAISTNTPLKKLLGLIRSTYPSLKEGNRILFKEKPLKQSPKPLESIIHASLKKERGSLSTKTSLKESSEILTSISKKDFQKTLYSNHYKKAQHDNSSSSLNKLAFLTYLKNLDHFKRLFKSAYQNFRNSITQVTTLKKAASLDNNKNNKGSFQTQIQATENEALKHKEKSNHFNSSSNKLKALLDSRKNNTKPLRKVTPPQIKMSHSNRRLPTIKPKITALMKNNSIARKPIIIQKKLIKK